MGNKSSTPGEVSARQITREQLIKMTNKPSLLMNEMFDTMLKKITPNDLLALSNPAQCQKYVFFMADTIEQTFHKLKIVTKKDPKGKIIYYEKKDELTKPDSQASYSACLNIAYYYIRIFQVFGALMLTVMDDPNAGFGRSTGLNVRAPGIVKGEAGAPPPKKGWFSGGSVTFNEELLKRDKRKYLKVFQDLISKTGNYYTFDSNTNLYMIIPDSVSYVTVSLLLDKVDQKDIYASVKISTSSQASNLLIQNDYKLILSEFKIGPDDAKKAVSKPNVQFTLDEAGQVKKGNDALTSVTDFLVKQLSEVKNVVSSSPTSTQTTTQTGSLSTEKLVAALKNKQVSSFCVSRGLQLLNADVLFEPKKIVATGSRICKKSAYGPIPAVGASLATSDAFLSLDALFYDGYNITQNKDKWDFSIQPTNIAEYSDFLKGMRDTFSDPSKASQSLPKTLNEIVYSPKKGACDSVKLDKDLRIEDPKVVKAVLEKAQQLFGFQSNHTTNVQKFILNNLLIIQKVDGKERYYIHPRIRTGGIDALNKIVADARKLLVNYYSSCENIFQQGYTIARDAGKPIA